MPESPQVGRVLMGAGAVLLSLGILVSLLGKVPGFGRLPGDIVVRLPSVTFYLPLGTSILLSVLLTLLLRWFRR
jgi:hypothetical protein